MVIAALLGAGAAARAYVWPAPEVGSSSAIVRGDVALSPVSSRERDRAPRTLPAVVAGDLVFRSGRSTESALVRRLDPGSRFSHVGIAAVVDDQIGVLHVVPGGSESSATRWDPLAEFLSVELADEFGVMRLHGSDRRYIRAALRFARDAAARGVPFDSMFDLETDERLYCTELVWKAFRSAGLDLLDGGAGKRVLPVGPRYVMLSSLYDSSHLEWVE